MVRFFSSAVKALDGRSQVSTPCVGKMFDAQGALPKVTRKALGTVNRATENSVKTNGPLKQKQPNFSAKKVSVGYKVVVYKHFSTFDF